MTIFQCQVAIFFSVSSHAWLPWGQLPIHPINPIHPIYLSPMSDILKQIVSDLRVELTDEFDRNFTRKAFFTQRWKPRKDPNARGSLLIVTAALRRSIKSQETANGVRFTSEVPYATVHNEGGKGQKHVRAHQRRTPSGKVANVKAHTRRFDIPQRQFIGDSPEVRQIIQDVVSDNIRQFADGLAKSLK